MAYGVPPKWVMLRRHESWGEKDITCGGVDGMGGVSDDRAVEEGGVGPGDVGVLSAGQTAALMGEIKASEEVVTARCPAVEALVVAE